MLFYRLLLCLMCIKCVLVETHVSPFKCLLISRLLATEKKEMY